MPSQQIAGQIVDLEQRSIYPGIVEVADGAITQIRKTDTAPEQYVLPGFVDAHIHIESSMLPPAEFARLALPHGTVATVSDPHEIANVMGVEGVRYMIKEANKTPLSCNFGAPSCVPATSFETAGAEITLSDIRSLFVDDGLKYLSEMMNYPGVLNQDPLVMKKIALAQALGKPIDGHAPGLRGKQAASYAAAGISTDHECFTYEEALDKLRLGMHILIREGSAARNFDALHGLIPEYWQSIMFCSDDKHPDELILGHINSLVKRAVADLGYNLFDVLHCACVNPVKHYGLETGLLRQGDSADFIVVEDLNNFKVRETYIAGEVVAQHGKALFPYQKPAPINHFNVQKKRSDDFKLTGDYDTVNAIVAEDGQLVTGSERCQVNVNNGVIEPAPERDLLKITVVNRYQNKPPAVGFIRRFGLKQGAIASSVAHDSHNIIAVGVDDQSIADAVNAIIDAQGGICVCDAEGADVLPLPIAGLMSDQPGEQVAKDYKRLSAKAKAQGSELEAPFMTLSFMALLVIPSLKMSDKGLFDGNTFQFVER